MKKNEESPLEYVQVIARTLQEWNPRMLHVLRKNNSFLRWDRDGMRNLIESFLSPLRMIIYVAAKKYEPITDEFIDIKSRYRYKYKIEMVSAKACARWNNPQLHAKLNLPPYNEFIPTRITVKPDENKVIENSLRNINH